MLESAREQTHEDVLQRALAQGLLRLIQRDRVRSLIDHGLSLSQVLVGSGLMTPEAYQALIREHAPEALSDLPKSESLRFYEGGRHVLMAILCDPDTQTEHIHERSHGSFWPAMRARFEQMFPRVERGWFPHRLGGRRRIHEDHSAHILQATHAWKRITEGDGHVLIERPDEDVLTRLRPYLCEESIDTLRSSTRERDDEDRRLVRIQANTEQGFLFLALLSGRRLCVCATSEEEVKHTEDLFRALAQSLTVIKQLDTPHGSAWRVFSV